MTPIDSPNDQNTMRRVIESYIYILMIKYASKKKFETALSLL